MDINHIQIALSALAAVLFIKGQGARSCGLLLTQPLLSPLPGFFDDANNASQAQMNPMQFSQTRLNAPITGMRFNQQRQNHQGNRLLQWVQSVRAGLKQVPHDFNWSGLAEAAALRARYGNDQTSSQPDLEWAKVAILIYSYLMDEVDSPNRASLEHSEMSLKAYLTGKLGAVPNDPILDVDQIIQWFFENLHISLDEAEKKASSWRKLAKEEILELQQIKNRLAIIKTLADSNLLPPNQELSAWLALREKLP